MGWSRAAAAVVAAAVVVVSTPGTVAVVAAAAAPPPHGRRCPYTVTTEVAGRWTRTILTVQTPSAIAQALAKASARRLGGFPPCARHRPGRRRRGGGDGGAAVLPPSGGCIDALPRHAAWFYPLTRGYSAADGWIMPMLAAREPTRAARRGWAAREFGRPGWTAADVRGIAALLDAANATAAAAAALAPPSPALALATANAVYRRVTRGAGVPAGVVAASAATPGTLAAAVVAGRPAKAKRGLAIQRRWAAAVVAARRQEAAAAARENPNGRHPPAPHPQSAVEVVQGVVEAAFAVPRLLLAVAAAEAAAAAAPDRGPPHLVSAGSGPRLPPLPTVILPDVTRIAVGGFTWPAASPVCPAGAVPDGTLIKAAVGDATRATRTAAWLFGGAWSADRRPCAAAAGVLGLARDVQLELRRRHASRMEAKSGTGAKDGRGT